MSFWSRGTGTYLKGDRAKDRKTSLPRRITTPDAVMLSAKQECLVKLFCMADAKKWKILPGSEWNEETAEGVTANGRPRH